jgi:Asp-tRNA(Asn)/Glu-tRNA(Gln) amidotransferase C subunit
MMTVADSTDEDDVLDGAILRLAVLRNREAPVTAADVREFREALDAILRALQTVQQLRATPPGRPAAEVHELRPRLRPGDDDHG